MDKVLFSVGSFDVLLWHLLAVLGLIVILALIVVIAVLARKKSALKDESAAEQPQSKDVETKDETLAAQPAVQSTDNAPIEEESANDVTVVEEEDDEPEEDIEPATEEEAAQEEKAAREQKRPKNYHISLRADGKWQVKLSKGAKPLKLFDTQAQAIAFAKEKARNQEGTITIHKVNGQIRKQKY